MLELVITACLLSNPSHCKGVSLTSFEQAITPYQCMMQANVEIPKWIESNPKYFAKKWTCRQARSFAEI